MTTVICSTFDVKNGMRRTLDPNPDQEAAQRAFQAKLHRLLRDDWTLSMDYGDYSKVLARASSPHSKLWIRIANKYPQEWKE